MTPLFCTLDAKAAGWGGGAGCARRAGFAYGTLPGHPERGEEAFLVELAADATVSAVVRAFSRPANWFWWLGAPVLRLAQELYTRRYLRALAR